MSKIILSNKHIYSTQNIAITKNTHHIKEYDIFNYIELISEKFNDYHYTDNLIIDDNKLCLFNYLSKRILINLNLYTNFEIIDNNTGNIVNVITYKPGDVINLSYMFSKFWHINITIPKNKNYKGYILLYELL